jgi:hypothetical protein
MVQPKRSEQNDETEVAETVATTLDYPRKVKMSHICKTRHTSLFDAGLECGRGIKVAHSIIVKHGTHCFD